LFWVAPVDLSSREFSCNGQAATLVGSALGSGVTESAFGGETTKGRTKWTIDRIAIFFVTAILLSMTYVLRKHHSAETGELPTFEEAVKIKKRFRLVVLGFAFAES
jgi:preprotein translocase subunit SecG